ncbi:MAG: hypothetical protein KatS3mg011_1523 [Acidimicrobiia bacterium]|nr:MAG: hypothetical protein KatS3mg011_1523 [Acidimicrobiia bacterium]
MTELVPRRVGEYVELGLYGARTMIDLGMLVVGSALLGLAAAVVGDGLGLIRIGLGLSIGALLGSALVIAVVAAFAFGVASEGSFGANRSLLGPPREVAVARFVGGLAVSTFLAWAGNRLSGLVADLAYPLSVGAEVLRASGVGGVFTSLLVVPAVWAIRRGLDRLEWGPVLELPVIYVGWVVATLAALDLP